MESSRWRGRWRAKEEYEGQPWKRHAHGIEQIVWRHLENVSVTVFVDNILDSMTRDWIWQLFSNEVEVIDVFISRKKQGIKPNTYWLRQICKTGGGFKGYQELT